MKRVKLSGAQNRKRKQKNEQESIKSASWMSSYLSKVSNNSCKTAAEFDDLESDGSESEVVNESVTGCKVVPPSINEPREDEDAVTDVSASKG